MSSPSVSPSEWLEACNDIFPTHASRLSMEAGNAAALPPPRSRNQPVPMNYQSRKDCHYDEAFAVEPLHSSTLGRAERLHGYSPVFPSPTSNLHQFQTNSNLPANHPTGSPLHTVNYLEQSQSIYDSLGLPPCSQPNDLYCHSHMFGRCMDNSCPYSFEVTVDQLEEQPQHPESDSPYASAAISHTSRSDSVGVPRGHDQVNTNCVAISRSAAYRTHNQHEAQGPQLDTRAGPFFPGDGSLPTGPTSQPLLPPKQFKCCRFMLRSWLPPGILPSKEETEAYLRKEFSWTRSDGPLTLRNYIQSRSGRNREGITARALAICAIWSSERGALTTAGIRQALMDADQHYNPSAAIIQSPGGKRTNWAATVASALSTSTIFVRKTADGRPSKEWRLDVRGQDFHCKKNKCRHMGQAFPSP